MAGWIKWCIGLEQKWEVRLISKQLGIARLHAAGACMATWAWAYDEAREDGDTACVKVKPGCEREIIDELVELPGFADALISVGWLHIQDGSILFPKWSVHNSATAKQRALNAKYQDSHRRRQTAESHQSSTIDNQESSTTCKDFVRGAPYESKDQVRIVPYEHKDSVSAAPCGCKESVSTSAYQIREDKIREEKRRGEERRDPPTTSNVNQTSSGDSSVGCNESKIRGENCGEIGQADSPPAATQHTSEPPVVAIPEQIAALEFACQGPQKVWTMDGRTWHALTTAYPAIDVAAEVRKAWCWLAANPSRRKTARGMSRFLANWMARAVDAPKRSAPVLRDGNGEFRSLGELREERAKQVVRNWAAKHAPEELDHLKDIRFGE
ncbi:MAG: hypothetical protein KatS3mg038_3076 [Candidatus Kapaibacterium sp.]|nr:MAG: hypothetical protein KatS3mg038_3076 [Candidatus Kapabacteria bacterium]